MQNDDNGDKDDGAEKVRFNMWLKPDVYKKFKRVAMIQGRSLSDIARQLIYEFVNKQGDSDD